MEDNPVEIVHLPVSQWAAYRALRLAALQQEPAAFSAIYQDNLTRPDSFWQDRLAEAAAGGSWLLFASCQGQLVGMIGAYPDRADPGAAVIISVYVAREFRGRGIGNLLMSAILAELKESGYRKAVLSVNAAGTPAVNLYLRCGFAITAQESGPMGDGQVHTGYRMEKDLTG